VQAEGVTFSGVDLDLALTRRLPPILSDLAGTRQIQDLLGGVANTAFAADILRAALKPTRTVYDWQVGEAMAEAYLADHTELDQHFESARKAAQTGGDASLDVILRWLHVASRRMVASAKAGVDRAKLQGKR
jgi:hypothetical protein